MSTLRTQKVTPLDGETNLILGDSGDTITIPAGATITNSGTATGFGKVVQVVNVQSGALITTTTVLPSFDDTIPQNTEGVELMTLAITPTNASNILEITVVTNLSLSVATSSHTHVTALFQDSTADALASMTQSLYVANGMSNTTFKHRMTAGTVSETTFKVRGGSNMAGTTSFNGSSGARVNGGTMASSITITEIAV
mgnify:CR=1 FL=1